MSSLTASISSNFKTKVSSFTFIHTNDLHGKLDHSRLPFLLQERSKVDFYFDSGDCIKSGNLAIPLAPEPVWPLLQQANCTASTLGNRESQPIESAFLKKIQGVNHPITVCNLAKKDGSKPFAPSIIIQHNNLRIGIIGTMVAMVTAKMKTQFASAYLWENPIAAAIQEAEKIKPKTDILIALTHIGFQNDKLLAEQTDLFQIILGGHSHHILEQPQVINKTAICQGGSHGKFIGKYKWEEGRLSGELLPWPIS